MHNPEIPILTHHPEMPEVQLLRQLDQQVQQKDKALELNLLLLADLILKQEKHLLRKEVDHLSQCRMSKGEPEQRVLLQELKVQKPKLQVQELKTLLLDLLQEEKVQAEFLSQALEPNKLILKTVDLVLNLHLL